MGKKFKINKYITLKLELLIPEDNILGSVVSSLAKRFLNYENMVTMIYVGGKRFLQCKYLLMDVPIKQQFVDNIQSIDEASELLDHSLEMEQLTEGVNPEIEFWAHCSNLQVWVENEYDTRLLHRNLAFPLLKKLSDLGDPMATRVFKEEIAKRFASGHHSVIQYLLEEHYLDYLTPEEIKTMIEDLNSEMVDYVEYNQEDIGIIFDKRLDLSYSHLKSLSAIKDFEKLEGLESLDLSHNALRNVRKLKSLTNLRELNLAYNFIKDIEGIKYLVSLRELSLQGNRLREIRSFEHLIHLERLKLYLNPIKLSEWYLIFARPQQIVKYCESKH